MNRVWLFLIGAVTYALLECLWRGRTHISMFLAGGVAMVLLGGLYDTFPAMPLLWLSALGALTITALEFVVGAIVNVKMGLAVWDYSNIRGNVYGQICPPFSLLWLLLSAVGFLLIQVVNAV